MRLEINNTVRATISRKKLARAAEEFVKIEKKHKNAEVSLAFVGDKTIKDLNWKYRGKRKATDVLSFCERDAESGTGRSGNFLGEIVICYPQAKRQALEARRSVTEEILFLFAHGLLHLAGYDHGTVKKYEEMIGLGESIVRKTLFVIPVKTGIHRR